MSSKLLEEAIVDAQKLRDLAEQTAKNKIIEAVMPQIREMVNKRILGESIEEAELDESERKSYEVTESDEDVDESLAEALANMISERSKEVEESEVEEGKQHKSNKLKDEVSNIEESIFKLRKILSVNPGVLDFNADKIARKIVECSKKAMLLQNKLLINESVTNRSLNRRLEKSIKELRIMARKNRNIFDFLFQEGGRNNRRLNEATLSIEFDDDEKERLGDSYDELADILAAAGLNISGAEAPEGEEEGGEEEEELDFGDDEEEGEEGEEEEESEEGEEEDLENESYFMEIDEMEQEGVDESYFYESDRQKEARYQREARRQKEARRQMQEIDEIDEEDIGEGYFYESDYQEEYGHGKRAHETHGMEEEEMKERMREARRYRRIRENAAVDKASHFGGAEVLGDVILDLDEEDLINVLADELGKYDGVKEPRMRAESRHRSARADRRLQESLRNAQGEANQYRRAAKNLQKQLQEMNLFNAKLLYANKLMQNKDLTSKQQRTIVEALDNAKTLREAKLLFESLTESLGRRTSSNNSATLKEGLIRPQGSASRSTRSAAPANASGVDSDRWAVLAGIK